MKISEDTTNIIKALIEVQKELKPVGKDRENPFANSRYATLDAILQEVLPLLTDNGIVMTQEPVTETTDNHIKIGVVTRLFHESGEYMEFEPLFMNLEKGAKMNMAQSAGSIITYAKRYAISAILGVSTGEDDDGVQSNNKGSNQYNQQPQRPSKPKPQPPETITKEQDSELKLMIEELAEHLNDEDAKRKTTLWLVGEFGESGGHISSIEKRYFIQARDALQMMIDKNKPEEPEQEDDVEVEQESLLEGSTTQPKDYSEVE